ncbi:MAG: TonB-dependent receptor plug domain-containing protein [Myxococcota bacterium]
MGWTVATSLGWLTAARAADPSTIEEQPLADLLDLMDDHVDAPTSVADREQRSQREASALVTVLTGAQLEALGARDVLDALRLLPSVEFAGDVWNTTSILVRGGSGERVLVLLDGHPWNEMMYGLTSFGNRLPVSMIDRIEVLRGPGSAIYGQNAMFAVIRIVTRASTVRGVRVDAVGSWLPSGVYGRQDLTTSVGGQVGEDGHVGITAVLGRGRRSDQPYTDVYGNTIDLGAHSDLNPALVSGTVNVGGFELALAAEQYRTTWQDGGSQVYPRDHDNWYSEIYGRVGYRWALSDRVGARTGLASRFDEPWRSTRDIAEGAYGYFRDRGDRTVTGFELSDRVFDRLRLDGGGETGIERGHSREPGAPPHVTYVLGAGWVQAAFETAPADWVAGVRFDANTAFGQAVSPRIAVAQAWRRVHYKAAVNRAFRAPGLVHARYGVDPETITTFELEGGVGPTAWSYLTASVYDNLLDRPMLYRYEFDPDTGIETEGYVNGAPTGTAGAEVELQLLSGPLTVSAAWAGLRASTPPPDWGVPGAPDRLLGAPAHKGVVRATWDSGEHLTLGAVGTALGPRWTIAGVTPNGDAVYSQLPAALLVDLSVRVRHLGLRGLSVSGSVHDLLDQNPAFLQGYDDQHAPMSGEGREVLLQLTVER